MVRLLDLQLLYGFGANKKFEELCLKLLRSQYDAHGVRPNPGDGGVDVFVGSWDDPDGIDVYQVKYFPNGIKKSQQDQVIRSFRTCINNPQFRTKSWTLCVPLDLSPDEITWFTHWRSTQITAPLAAENIKWMGETELGTVLSLPINAGIKEDYFPQEHMKLLREMYKTLVYLVDDLNTRPTSADLETMARLRGERKVQIRYKNEVYAPLHHELMGIRNALEHAQQSKGAYLLWIPVEGSECPERFRSASTDSYQPTFHCWPKFRHDFRFFGALTAGAIGRLNALEQLINKYNEAVEGLHQIVEDILRDVLAAALKKEAHHWFYRSWKTEDPRSPNPWFEWIECAVGQQADAPAPEELTARWWLDPPLATLGWILANNSTCAAQVMYEAHQKVGRTPLTLKKWYEPIFAEVLATTERHKQMVHDYEQQEKEEEQPVDWDKMKEMDTFYFMNNFWQAQEKLLMQLAEITTTLLNVMLDIRFRHEGGVPPL